jgi:hypothetical protein
VKVTLTRRETGDEGTFGDLSINDGMQVWTFKTGELPWRGNAAGRSCIKPEPGGAPIRYKALYLFSPKHGNVYHLQGVEGRTEVEMHSANLMGDAEKGFVSQLLGCIALGMDMATFPAGAAPAGAKAQRGLVRSKEAMAAFERMTARQPLELEVRWA